MNVLVNSGITEEKVLEPEVNLEPTGLPIKFKGGRWGRMRHKEFHFKVTYCKTCKNIDVVDKSKPKEIISNRHNASIVIPSILNSQLEIHSYEPQEIIQLINSVTNRLEKIYKKWSQAGGINPCKGNRVGKKIKLALYSGIKIPCYVIVEAIRNKIVFRLSYGGSNVNCD